MDIESFLLGIVNFPLAITMLVGTEFLKKYFSFTIRSKWVFLAFAATCSVANLLYIGFSQERFLVEGKDIWSTVISFFIVTTFYGYLIKPLKNIFRTISQTKQSQDSE